MQDTVTNNSLSEIDKLNKEAWQINRKDGNKALELAELALQKATAINYSAGIAQAKKTIGACYIWRSESEKGAQYCFEAISLFKVLHDKASEAAVYVNLGTNSYFLSDYDTAIKFYKTSLDINTEIKNEIGMAGSLNGIGAVYCAIEQYEKALESLLASEELCIKNNSIDGLANIQDGIAESYLCLKHYTKALEYYEKCLNTAIELGSLNLQAYSYNGLGNTYLALQEFDKALDYFQKCLTIRKDIDFKFGVVTTLNHIGNLYIQKHDQENAIDYLTQAFEMANQVGSKEGVYQSSEKLADLFEKRGEIEKALQYQKIYHQAKEDVRNHKSAQLSKNFELQNRVLQSQSERALLEERAKELESYSNNLVLMSEIGQEIISQLNVASIVETVYDQVNRLMDATGFGIGLFNREKQQIIFPLFIEGGEKFNNITYDIADEKKLSVICFKRKEEIIINDFDKEIERYFERSTSPNFGKKVSSILYLPLTVKGRVLGVITIQSFKTNAYNPYEVNILRNLASYTSIALDNANLYQEQERIINKRTAEVIAKKEEIEKAYLNNKLLSEIGQQITSTLNFEDVFERLHKYVNQLMDADCFGVRLYDPVNNVVEYKYGIERGVKDEGVAIVSMDDDDNYTVWCIKNRKEIFLNDNQNEYTKYVKQIKVVSGDMPHSLIFYPINIGEKVIGAITIQSFKKFAYKEHHLDLLKSLASYIAIALENASLYESTEEKVKLRTEELVKQKEQLEQTYNNTKLLSQIGNDITSTLSVVEIIEKVYANINSLMDASVFGIGQFEAETNSIVFHSSIEKGEKLPTHVYGLDNPDRPAVKCYLSQTDYFINNFTDQLLKQGKIRQKPVVGENTESIIYVPVTYKDHKLAVLTVQSFKENAYSEYQLQIVKNLAVYVAIALENANLYESLEERVEERTKEINTAYQNNRLLSEIGQQITSTLNFDNIFERLYKYINQLMDAEVFSVRIYHPETDMIEYKFEIEKGVRDHEVILLPASAEGNYSGWVIRNKKEIVINDHEQEYHKYVSTMSVVAGDMPESLMFYPVMIGERVLGVITVQSFKKNVYTAYHLDILKNLASYTAIALDNASLYETMEEKVKQRTAEVVAQKEEIEKTYENTRILSQIGKDISTTFSIQEIINKVYANLNTLMDATCFGIGIFRERSNEIVFPSTIEKKKSLMPYTYSLKDADRPAVWCFTSQQDYMINNFSEEFVKSNKVQDYQAKEGDNPESIIYVPITQNDKRIGVITVQSFKANAYKDYHLQIVKSLAVYVAIAIDNASLYNNLEDRVRERTEEIEKNYNDTRLIGEISKELSSSLSVDTIISSVYKNINQLMKADSFGIGIVNLKTNKLEFNGFRENQSVIPDFTIDVDDQNRLGAICFKMNKEIVINDFVTEHSKYIKLERKPILGNDNMSVVYLPLYSKNENIGVITVQSLDKDAYSEYHLSILKNLAVSIGIAIDNASLYETLEEKVKERTLEVVKQKEEIERTYQNTRLLGEIGKEISSTLSIEGIITKVYDHINELMDATALGIGIYREEENDLYHPCVIEKGKKLPPFSYALESERIAIRCFKMNEELVINDWINEYKKYIKDDYAPVAGESPQSIIYIPLSLKDKVVGVLSVQSFETNAYNDYHLNILRNLGVHIASALENANLYQSMEDRVEKRTEEIRVAYENTRLLGQIAEDISSSLSVETIVSKVYQNVNKLMNATCFGIGVYNEKTKELEFKGFVENDVIMEDFSYNANDPNRLAAQCFSGEKEILINDYTVEYVNYIKGIQAPVSGKDSTSIIYLPIYSKDRAIGVITVQSYDKNVYSDYQFNILKNLAVSVGIALDNASLYQNLEEKVKERTLEVVKQKEEIEKANENTRLLSEIGKAITSTLSISEIIEKVYSNVNNLMDATGFGIGVYNPATEQIVYPSYIEGTEKFENIVYEKQDVNRLTNVCFYQDREIVINNFLREIKHYISNYVPPLMGQNVESIIYLPLILKDKKLGVITVQSFKRNRYTDYHVQILKNLAVYVAIAIDNASLYENMEQCVIERTKEVTQQKEQLEKNFNDTKLIAQISKVITSSLSVETIVSMAYENINSLMSAESFGIGIYNEKTQSLQFPGFIERSEKMPYFEFFLKDKERFAVWSFENEKEILINDIYTEYNKYLKDIKAPIAGDTPLSVIYMPLFSKDKKIGVITVQSFSKNAYSEYQLNILRNLANSVAIAIDNAALYENLEEKVKARTEEVFKQKAIIEEKNKDITDSIQYAKKIQLALMTETNLFNDTFNESFVYFKPKDIVSGDFYWATKKIAPVVNANGELENHELVYLAVCDSTGHGVPGAFMSLLNISFLNEAINEKNITAPNEVFNYVRMKLINNISKEGQKDGFDGTLLCINRTTNEVSYSSAFNSPILVSNNSLVELQSDRMPVGYGEKEDHFSLKRIEIKKGDTLYLYTDGYADQFGGPRGKKFMYKKLNEYIQAISAMPLQKQWELLGRNFEEWKGNLEQIDDVCIIGLKF
ncbi:MAG: GAF domain-containing protein [Sphingobacteriaceae bacterium]